MKSYIEIQEQIEKLEYVLINLTEQEREVGRYSPIGKNIGHQAEQIKINIQTLQWVIHHS